MWTRRWRRASRRESAPTSIDPRWRSTARAAEARARNRAHRTRGRVTQACVRIDVWSRGVIFAARRRRVDFDWNVAREAIAAQYHATPARSKITPVGPNVDPNSTIALAARAYDGHGYVLALPPLLRWSATAGSIDPWGHFHAGSHDANIAVHIGETVASARVTVGSHDVALPFAERARFVTARRGGQGAVAKNAGCRSCVGLTFCIGDRRARRLRTIRALLACDTIGLAFDLQDDGSAARVRVGCAINEDVSSMQHRLGGPGWRSVSVRFPNDTRALTAYGDLRFAAQGHRLV